MKDQASLIKYITDNIKLGEILRSKGLITYMDDEEQFSCPFHGLDKKKSSRYYRATDTAYCWVCTEKWDVISWTKKEEGLTFNQTINHLIRSYHLDISKVPEAEEVRQERIYSRHLPSFDERKLKTEKISQAIKVLKDDVDPERYTKMVYAYMSLKYMIPDEKYEESFEKVKGAIFRVIEDVKNA